MKRFHHALLTRLAKIPVVLSAEEVTHAFSTSPRAPASSTGPRSASPMAAGCGAEIDPSARARNRQRPRDIAAQCPAGQRDAIRVDQGKGRRDRHVMLSPGLAKLLRDYNREAQARGLAVPGAAGSADLDTAAQPGLRGGRWIPARSATVQANLISTSLPSSDRNASTGDR